MVAMRSKFPTRWVPGIAIVLAASGCLDVLGHEEEVIQTRSAQGTARIEDDRIEDKHPAFDPTRTVTEMFGPPSGYGSCAITMNKSAAVTKLDIVPLEDDETVLDKKLFRGRS
jgi:hypothetical protein